MLRALFVSRRTHRVDLGSGTPPHRVRPRLERLEDRLAPASFPIGFSQTNVATFDHGSAMDFAPDGRLFVTQQTGDLRVIRDGNLLPGPFVHLDVDSSDDRGLLGVAFDPDFANNNYVYVYYTTASSPAHNRVSRFTADGDVAVPGSEQVLLDLDPLVNSNHNGGAIHFGPDGTLYVAVGDNGTPPNSQDLHALLGKILRINADGSIPPDNPFVNNPDPQVRHEIWAYGLRNPYTFSFQPGTGRLFINDVGSDGTISRERIFEGIAGANYGWPFVEGYNTDARFVGPLYAYPRTQGASISGGAFYDPAVNPFPAQYTGKYFFSDFVNSWIRVFDPSDLSVRDFASGLDNLPVDLKVGPDGSLYYLSFTQGVFRITTDSSAEQIVGTQDSGYSDSSGWIGYPDGYSGIVRYALPGTGTQTAAWQFPGLTNGSYDVQVTWPNYSDAATNATFNVYNGSTLVRTVLLDQTLPPVGVRVNGRNFQSLGAVDVTAGALRVELVVSDGTSSYALADAVRLVGAMRQLGSINVDKTDAAGYSETGSYWVTSDPDGYNGRDRVSAADKGDTAAWQATSLLNGTYDVQVTWPAYFDGAIHATYRIYDDDTLLSTVTIDQTRTPAGTATHGRLPINGEVFQSLGAASITSGTLCVVLSDDFAGDNYVVADAVRFVQTA
jgi:glucose/arabinose dehydrogenase